MTAWGNENTSDRARYTNVSDTPMRNDPVNNLLRMKTSLASSCCHQPMMCRRRLSSSMLTNGNNRWDIHSPSEMASLGGFFPVSPAAARMRATISAVSPTAA